MTLYHSTEKNNVSDIIDFKERIAKLDAKILELNQIIKDKDL